MYGSPNPLNSFLYYLEPPNKEDCILKKASKWWKRRKIKIQEQKNTAALGTEYVQGFIRNLSEEKQEEIQELEKQISEQDITQKELLSELEQEIETTTSKLKKEAARKIKIATDKAESLDYSLEKERRELSNFKIKYATATKRLEELTKLEPGYAIAVDRGFLVVTAGKKFIKLYQEKLGNASIVGYNLLSLLDDKRVTEDLRKAISVQRENFHMNIPAKVKDTYMLMTIEFKYNENEFIEGRINLKKLPFFTIRGLKAKEEKQAEIFQLSEFQEQLNPELL